MRSTKLDMKWLSLVMLAACTSSSTGIPTVTCPTDSTLTYTNFGAAFFDANCLSCHASDEQPRLGSQALIQSNKSRILNAAVYSSSMPEDRDLTTAQRTQLGEWLACGAP